MSEPRIWITRRLSDATIERAQRDYDVVIDHDDTPGTADEIIAASGEFDAIILCHLQHFTGEVVAQFSECLKIVANHSVGVDHCDLQTLKACGIIVPNTLDVLSDAAPKLAMLLMLGASCGGRRPDCEIGYLGQLVICVYGGHASHWSAVRHYRHGPGGARVCIQSPRV